MSWLESYFALCGGMSPLGKVVLASDLGIALAYFAIPVGLLIVWRRRLDDLPYPWMFALFAAFIVACGLTHAVHALQMPWTTFEHTVAEAALKATCAALSIGTAIALIAIMPKALRLVSPRARRAELERQVRERTSENRELLREINHRLGNQLQVIASAVRIERRRATEEGDRAALGRIAAVVDELVSSYHADERRYRGAAPGPDTTEGRTPPAGRAAGNAS
ncbi:MAG: histidine kinase dimerization/phosphoacceptor domain -containing protein [Beijerinckiaceae bacterium]